MLRYVTLSHVMFRYVMFRYVTLRYVDNLHHHLLPSEQRRKVRTQMQREE